VKWSKVFNKLNMCRQRDCADDSAFWYSYGHVYGDEEITVSRGKGMMMAYYSVGGCTS
jgi:hypothetical protein